MIFFIFFAIVLLFGFVILFGAPYLPTLKDQTDEAIGLLNLKPGSTIIELGSGDGRVARRMAKQGYKVVGYELNPLLAIASRLTTWRYRKKVRIIWGNYWYKNWPEADGVYVFLLDRFMTRLDRTCIEYAKNTGPLSVVSYTFKIPGKKPAKKSGALYLYHYK